MHDGPHFKSTGVECETPQDLFDELDREFGFTLDACASAANAKCERYFDEVADGLMRSWAGEVVWCNPPYGRQIPKWANKIHLEAEHATIVALVPSRTDTRWWHDHMMEADEIRFVRGRLHFNGAVNPAPFPSAIVVFRR